MMKRGSSTIECIDIPDVGVRTRRARRVKKIISVPVIIPKVKKLTLEERKRECRILLNWKPKGLRPLDAPFTPLEPTFSEVPLAMPRPDCVAGAKAPAAPAFSTLFGRRHTIDYPFTHLWTVAPEAERTVWDFKTVNRNTIKQISFSRDQDQKLLLT